MIEKKNAFERAIPFVLAISMLLSPAMGFGATIYVNPGDSIQDTIDNASAGDTIIVNAGSYTENIAVKKQLIIQASGAVTVTANDGDTPCIVIKSDGSGSTIQGFGLTGAENDDGIYLDNADNCLINNNTIHNNGHFGIRSVGKGNTISGNTISSNGTSKDKDGIYSEKSSQTAPTTISGNTIEGNGKYGIHCKQDYNTITGNNISENVEDGVRSEGSYNNISNNHITKNGHFGIHSVGKGSTISGNTISSNGTSNGKDGIYSEKSSQTAPTTISDNTIEGNGKYGIHCKQDYNAITGNNISDNGDHGVYSGGSYNNISENTLKNTKPIGKDGIHIKGHNNTLSDNTIDNIQANGIFINGKNNKAFGSSQYSQKITKCDQGIRLTTGDSPFQSKDTNEVYNNVLEKNTNGIHILLSSYNEIYDNKIIENRDNKIIENHEGIIPDIDLHTGNGIWARDSSYNKIHGNKVEANEKVGIYIETRIGANSKHNEVYDNTISGNILSGISIINAGLSKTKDENNIYENDISLSIVGIEFLRSNANMIHDNTIEGVGGGIALELSKDTTISQNNISVDVIGILLANLFSSSDDINFNRIMSIGHALVNNFPLFKAVNAKYNWWGSNADPGSKIQGTVDYTPYLVLKANANPEKIYDAGPLTKSTITANLWYDSSDPPGYHDPAYYHVPDGIRVKFKNENIPSLGSLNPHEPPTSNGSATSTFTATGSGDADITATVDSQTVHTSVTIEALSFLSITKAESSDPVIAGRDIIYTMKVHNKGPDQAENVRLTDVIPPHLDNVRYSLSSDSGPWENWPPASGYVDLGNLPVDHLKSVWIIGSVDPATSSGTVLTNTSSVTSTTPPGHTSTAEISTTVRTIAELDLNKAVDEERPDVGERVIFTVTAHNNGPSDGHDLHIDDVMPPEFSDVTITPSEGTYENSVWTIPYLAVGEAANLTMQGTVTPVMAGKTTTNTATRALSKESASVSIYVPRADLYLLGEDRSCYVGENIPITFKVGNRGPDSAENVNATFQIPDGLKFVSISVDQGTYVYDPATTTVNWDLGEVPLGDPYLYLVVRAEKVGKFTIEPTMTTTTYDPDLPDNIGSATVTVKAIIPTLGQTGLIMLGLLFLILGALRLRCRS